MRVAHIVPSLEDRHGGPSRSVRALANAQANHGASIDLLTTAAPDSAAPAIGNDRANIRFFPREIPRWACRSTGLRDHLHQEGYELVHHHSLWLLTLRYASAAAETHAAPLVLSPRGMLSGWAYQHHRWRKRLAEILIHPGAFARTAGWHATSETEADDIRRLGFIQPVCVSPNGVKLPDLDSLAAARTAWLMEFPQLKERRVALYYSRFHRKKRVRELVDLWLSEPRGDWILFLAGVPEEYSVAEIKAWIASRNAQNRIVVEDGRERPPPYAAAALFLLPSHSENFGLVIAEAMAAGLPVLVTDTTPWHAVATHGAGRCESWPAFAPALSAMLASSEAELMAAGARGRAWMARDFSWENCGRRLLDFYRTLVETHA